MLLIVAFGYCGYSQFFYHANGDKVFFEENSTVKYIYFNAYNEKVQQIILSLKEIGICDWDDESLILRCALFPNKSNQFNEIFSSNCDEIKFISSEISNGKLKSVCGITNKVFVQTDSINNLYSYLVKKQIPIEKIETISIERNEYVLNLKSKCINSFQVANQIFENVNVQYSQPEFLHRDMIQNPLYPYQWGEKNDGQYCDTSGFDIQIESAWDITKGDSNIIVAVLDLGVDTNHEDIRGNLIRGKNVLTGENNGQEGNFDFHGTACAGIIAAEDNNIGCVGIAPLCHILPIRMSRYRYTTDSYIADAFRYIADSSNAAIASCSWIPNYDSPIIDNELLHFVHKGRSGKGGIVVFSAGNLNEEGDLLSDSCKPYCIIVGAICPDGTRKEFISCDEDDGWGSNYGKCLNVMAPGTKVPTTISVMNITDFTYVGSNYILDFDGTSAACPHVAGVAALVLSVNSNLSGRKVKEIIERTCTKVRPDIYDYDSIAPHGTWDYQMGYGLVNAYQAVLMAQGCKDYPYYTIDKIHGNVLWNTPITIGEDLVIDSLATLTVTDTVAFYSEARIIVRPGGTLVVDGGTLTSASDGEMWQGIIVEGNRALRQTGSNQGSVILTDATIENAREAISTHRADDSLWVGTGGIVQATNTLFRNNRRSVATAQAPLQRFYLLPPTRINPIVRANHHSPRQQKTNKQFNN